MPAYTHLRPPLKFVDIIAVLPSPTQAIIPMRLGLKPMPDIVHPVLIFEGTVVLPNLHLLMFIFWICAMHLSKVVSSETITPFVARAEIKSTLAPEKDVCRPAISVYCESLTVQKILFFV